MRRSAKRYVYRFFVDWECTDDKYFWCNPVCFGAWARSSGEDDGNDSFAKFSMYPIDGTNPIRELSEWEVANCPWYIKSDQWSMSFDQFEKSAFSKISKGEKLKIVLSEMKVSQYVREREACTLVEDVCLHHRDVVDQTRRPKAKPVAAAEADSRKETSSHVSQNK